MVLTVDLQGIGQRAVWHAYVSSRVPALLLNILQTDDFRELGKWTNEYMLSRVGAEVPVKVEVRCGADVSFGKGQTQLMPFGRFLSRFEAGDSSLYLTAQDVGVAADGHPELSAPPLSQLQHLVPLQPSFLGNLVPQQLNLWMGNAVDGASSGLHHDFHDNLYVLLRGRKCFRLYPPQAAKQMYTNGRIAKVHPNGRIVYEGQGDVNADGSSADDVTQWQARSSAEREVAAAQEAMQRGDEGAARRLAAAEACLDAALDSALELQMDDFDDFDSHSDAEGSDGPMGRQNTASATTGMSHDPDSFSRIDLAAMSDAHIRHKFPKFPGKAAAVELKAGQALYLPAGWFHEVTSFSGADHAGHLAFSYWFHPPDRADTPDGFDRPYSSDFWPSLWASRSQQLRHGGASDVPPDDGTSPCSRPSAPPDDGTDSFHTGKVDVTAELSGVESLRREPTQEYFYSRKDRQALSDRARIWLDLSLDLRDEFTWMTKQLFMFATIDFETPQNQVNQVVMLSRIITSQDEAALEGKDVDEMYPYVVNDQGFSLRGRPFNVTIAWDIMPLVGVLRTRSKTFTGFQFPDEYSTPPSTRQPHKRGKKRQPKVYVEDGVTKVDPVEVLEDVAASPSQEKLHVEQE